MNLLFKVTNANDPDNPLIGETNIKEHYPYIHKNKQWNTTKPIVRQATTKFLIPFLGLEFYMMLADRYNQDSPTPNGPLDMLVLHLQDALANYTIYNSLAKSNVQITDMGAQQQNSSEGTSAPVNQWSYKALRAQTSKDADEFLDTALKLMELEVAEGNAAFDLWKNSTAYDLKKGGLFRQTIELDDYLNIQGSRRSFMAIQKYIIKAEVFYLEPILGSKLLKELRDYLKTTYSDTTAANLPMARLLKHARRVAAEFGLFKAIPHLSILIDADGFKVSSANDGFNEKKNVVSENQAALEALKEAAEKDGKTYRATLIEFLHKNKTDYPTWLESDYYISSQKNSNRKIHGSRNGAVMF